MLFQRCGNRRESVCPSCSRLYARDTFEVIRCGVQGGKNIPDTVADNRRAAAESAGGKG